jgi:hypothetical protein
VIASRRKHDEKKEAVKIETGLNENKMLYGLAFENPVV